MTRKIMTLAATALLLLLSGLLAAQGTADLDEAISKAVRKLQQYPGRTREAETLREKYPLAVAADLASIAELRASGQPDIWLPVYNTYKKMDNRQKDIQSLPAQTLEMAGLTFIDLENELAESEHRATAYLNAHSRKLLATGLQADARSAYGELYQLARINPSSQDLDKMLRKSILTGASQVEFELQNRTGQAITVPLAEQLSRIVWEYRRARSVQTDSLNAAPGDFRFILKVVLRDLEVGPDQIRELEYAEERDILREGMAVDTIRCSVREYRQLKKARLNGAIEFFDVQAGRVVNTLPVSVESVFTNAYAFLQGDPNAAGEATRALLSSKKAAYPSREQMILDAAEEFARKAGEAILAD